MKKNIRMVLCIIGCVCIGYSVIMQIVISNREYVLSPDVTEWIFNATPEEFIGEYVDYKKPFNEFGTDAYIDDNGNLVLYLLPEQIDAWKESCSGAISAAQNVGYQINDDYSGFCIRGNKSEISTMIDKFPLWLIHEMLLNQILTKKSPETVSVEVSVIEEATGNILYQAFAPKQEIKLSVRDWIFTEDN